MIPIVRLMRRENHPDQTPDGSTLRDVVRKRAETLRALSTATARKPELVDRLNVSRSTVDRAVDALAAVGLVRRVDGEYSLTGQGRLALDRYDSYVDTTESLAAAAPLFSAIPADAEIDRRLIETGEIGIADPQAPEEAITHSVEAMGAADELRVFSPVVKTNYIRLVHEHVTRNDLQVQLVLESDAVGSFGSLVSVERLVNELLESELFSVYEVQESLPYMLYHMPGDPTSVGVTVHDSGGIVGAVVSTDDGAIEWASRQFDAVFESAEPLSL